MKPQDVSAAAKYLEQIQKIDQFLKRMADFSTVTLTGHRLERSGQIKVEVEFKNPTKEFKPLLEGVKADLEAKLNELGVTL